MNQVIRHSRRSNMVELRSPFPLSDEQINSVAPSVFATEKHESRGARYAFIDTRAVLAGLRREGFQPYEVRQTKVRDEGKREHTKHLIRMRHPHAKALANGDAPEIILLNSHDGSSSYRLISGWFRMVCSNGLVAGDIQNDIKVRHSGKVVDNVIEGAFRVVDELSLVGERVEEMRSVGLGRDEHLILAEAARQIRWNGADNIPVEAPSLIVPKRLEDRPNDLWTGFNVIQENVMKGGVAGRTATNRNTTTRAVQGVTENVRINRALWQMAEAFSGLKTGRVSVDEFQRRLVQQTPELAEVI